MNFGFLKIPWFQAANFNEKTESTVVTSSSITEAPKLPAPFNMKFFDWSFLSFTGSRTNMPATVNKALKKYAQSHTSRSHSGSKYSTVRFRPYVCKVPWHTGFRGILSQFFPRYGHYCGPNWSSGKDGGSLVWDKRPIDWLDYCCYCHDIGYDTHDQAELLKADLSFLECLESSNNINPKGNPQIAHMYKTMCISGLKHFLIPYRQKLLGFQTGQVPLSFRWQSDWKLKGWILHKDLMAATQSIFGTWLNNLKWKRHNLLKL